MTSKKQITNEELGIRNGEALNEVNYELGITNYELRITNYELGITSGETLTGGNYERRNFQGS